MDSLSPIFELRLHVGGALHCTFRGKTGDNDSGPKDGAELVGRCAVATDIASAESTRTTRLVRIARLAWSSRHALLHVWIARATQHQSGRITRVLHSIVAILRSRPEGCQVFPSQRCAPDSSRKSGEVCIRVGGFAVDSFSGY